MNCNQCTVKVTELSYLQEPVRSDGGPSSLHSLLLLIQAKKRWRWRLAPSCHCFLPARWQRGQPAPRRSSPLTDQPPIPAAPSLTKRRERRERRWECKCLLNELRSDTRPLEFGAFKQPSSSSFLLLPLLFLPSSLHTVLLSSLYCGWSCWAAAFKRGARVTGSRGRASSSACGRALKLEGGKWEESGVRRWTQDRRPLILQWWKKVFLDLVVQCSHIT